MKGTNMSKVYKPIDLVSTENNYKAYAVDMDGGERTLFLRNSQELKKLFEECSEDELSIYTLQSVVRAEEINPSDDYNDDDDEYDDDTDDEEDITTDINDVIDEVTKAFSNSLKEIVSKIK